MQKGSYADKDLYCNHHIGEQITHICLRADCKEQRAHCRKCNLTQHSQCGEEIKFLDEITDWISKIDGPGMEISNIIEQIIQKLKSVQHTYNSIIQKIKQYSGAPNLIDLNMTVAGILNNFSPQQIRKLIQGQELLDNLIESHFMPNITQNIVKNIGNLQKSPTNETESSSSTTKISKFDSIKNPVFSQVLDSTFGNENNNDQAQNKSGIDLCKMGKYEEGIEYFNKALEIINSKPQIDRESKVEYITNKASALIELRQFQHVIKTVDEGLALDPQNKTFFKFKVASLMRSDQFTQALKVVDEALELDPQNYKAHQFKGVVLNRLKKTEEAIESLCASYSIRPKKKTYFLLGQLLEQQGRFGEAKSQLESALNLNQNYEKAKDLLEKIQLKLKQK